MAVDACPAFRAHRRWRRDAIVEYLISGKDVRLDGAEHPKTTTFSPLKYGIDGYNRWLDPDGYPAVAPPGER